MIQRYFIWIKQILFKSNESILNERKFILCKWIIFFLIKKSLFNSNESFFLNQRKFFKQIISFDSIKYFFWVCRQYLTQFNLLLIQKNFIHSKQIYFLKSNKNSWDGKNVFNSKKFLLLPQIKESFLLMYLI